MTARTDLLLLVPEPPPEPPPKLPPGFGPEPALASSPAARRRLLQAGAAAVVAVALPMRAGAEQAEFAYKFANNVPPSHPSNIRGRQMVEAIRTETNGRVDIQIFPSNQLGSDTDTLSQLRSGGVEFFSLSSLVLSTLVPAAAINGIGFAFPDHEAVWRAMDGALGAYIRARIAKAGLVAMDRIWDNGFRQTTTATRPINSPDDLKGLKIRVPVAPLWTSMFKAFGAAPTSINFSEVYTSLQTRVVDAQENALSIVALAKLYEVQKFCSQTSHMWDGFWLLSNRKAWERLPENLRTIVAKHANAAALQQRADLARLNASLPAELAARGMVFNRPDAAPFRDKLRAAGFYAEWKQKLGDEAWSLLETTTGKLA